MITPKITESNNKKIIRYGRGSIVHGQWGGGGANLHVTPGLGPLPILAMMPGSDQHYKHYNVELL